MAARSQSIMSGTARTTRDAVSWVLTISVSDVAKSSSTWAVLAIPRLLQRVRRIECGRSQSGIGLEGVVRELEEYSSPLIDGQIAVMVPCGRDLDGHDIGRRASSQQRVGDGFDLGLRESLRIQLAGHAGSRSDDEYGAARANCRAQQ